MGPPTAYAPNSLILQHAKPAFMVAVAMGTTAIAFDTVATRTEWGRHRLPQYHGLFTTVDGRGATLYDVYDAIITMASLLLPSGPAAPPLTPVSPPTTNSTPPRPSNSPRTLVPS